MNGKPDSHARISCTRKLKCDEPNGIKTSGSTTSPSSSVPKSKEDDEYYQHERPETSDEKSNPTVVTKLNENNNDSNTIINDINDLKLNWYRYRRVPRMVNVFVHTKDEFLMRDKKLNREQIDAKD